MINRRIFESIRDFKEYLNPIPIQYSRTIRTTVIHQPKVHPFGPGYDLGGPHLSKPAYGYLLHRAALGLIGFGLPTYLVATGVELIPETAGPMYQSSMTGQPTVGTGGSALLSYQADPNKSIWANFWGFFTQ